jgi:hypothetical protein
MGADAMVSSRTFKENASKLAWDRDSSGVKRSPLCGFMSSRLGPIGPSFSSH